VQGQEFDVLRATRKPASTVKRGRGRPARKRHWKQWKRHWKQTSRPKSIADVSVLTIVSSLMAME
jgi:hypothetical protein